MQSMSAFSIILQPVRPILDTWQYFRDASVNPWLAKHRNFVALISVLELKW